jgi:hypothetical protein
LRRTIYADAPQYQPMQIAPASAAPSAPSYPAKLV